MCVSVPARQEEIMKERQRGHIEKEREDRAIEVGRESVCEIDR